jgi:carotene biosynthesis associated membrane protein
MPRTDLGTTLRASRAAVALAALTVLLQIGYPLVHGQDRDRLTVVTVLVFFLTSAVHAAVTRGAGWALRLVALSAGLGLLAEAVGVHTGFPFGHYAYGRSLGPLLLGVPLVIPLAWAMFAYPSLIVAQRLTHGWRVAVVGAAALAAWDLFLDPQMVAAHHWVWQQGGPSLNGIPLTNTAGWLAVGLVLMALLSRLPQREADDRVPRGLFLWTYASSVLANAAFFGRPGVALAGGLAMGLVAVPLLLL